MRSSTCWCWRPSGPDTPDAGAADVAFLRHWAVLRDDQRREVGGSAASVQLERSGDRLIGELQLLRARFALEPTERATRAEAASPVVLVPREPGRVHATAAYALDTDFGHRYWLMGVVEGERVDRAPGALLAVNLSLGPLVRERGEASRVTLGGQFAIAAATHGRR